MTITKELLKAEFVKRLKDISVEALLDKMDKVQENKPESSLLQLKTPESPYNLIKLPLSDRIKYLEKLKFNEKVKEVDRKFVHGKNIQKSIKWACNLPGSEGAVIKDIEAPYKFGDDKSWIKFRNLTDINVVVLQRVVKERDLYNYLVGVYLDGIKNINTKKVMEFNGKYVLKLGHTFNTKESVEEGSLISILVEEVWRHEGKDGIYYSIHKPRFNHVTDMKKTASLEDLDKIVTSIGFAVEYEDILVEHDEGSEIMIKNFPKRMQSNFKKIMDNKLWVPFVMDIHTIGRKLHRDFRLFIPNKEYGKVLTYNHAESLFEKKKLSGILEGFTLFKPSTIEDSGFDASESIQGTIKVPQPINWLFFDGITHDIGTAGTHFPGVFVISAHGVYTVREVNDHKIEFEFRSDEGIVNLKPIETAKKENAPVMLYPPQKLKSFIGNYSLHVAHIQPEKWIILFDKLKRGGPESKVTCSHIETINKLRDTCSINEICKIVNLSPRTIYRYLK